MEFEGRPLWVVLYRFRDGTCVALCANTLTGAVEYDPSDDCIHGLFWTARMWDRGLNTAGQIKYRGHSD